MFALGILDIVDFNVGMIFGGIGHLLESESVETVCHGENTFPHRIHSEIRTDFRLVEREIALTHFLGEIVIVPRFDCEGVAHIVAEFLHRGNFLSDLSLGRLENLHEQFLGGFGGLGHLVGSHKRGKSGESEQTGFFGTVGYNLFDDRTVVIVGRSGICGISFPHLLAQFAVVGMLQHSQTAGSVESENPFALLAARLGLGGGIVDGAFGQSCQILLLVNNNFKSVVGLKKILVELEIKFGQTIVDSLELSLLVVGEKGAPEHKLVVGVGDSAALVKRLCRGVDIVIKSFDAFEQFVVHHHLVGECGVAGEQLFGNLGKFGRGISLGEGEKHRAYTLESGAETVERQNSVLECRSLGIRHD